MPLLLLNSERMNGCCPNTFVQNRALFLYDVKLFNLRLFRMQFVFSASPTFLALFSFIPVCALCIPHRSRIHPTRLLLTTQ